MSLHEPFSSTADLETVAVVLQFRAGIMRKQGGTKLVADPRRGLARLNRMSDGLLHFQWVERGPDGQPAPIPPELERTIAPHGNRLAGASAPGWAMTKLAAGGARVLKLAYTDPTPGGVEAAARTVFLWPQEPDAAGDDALVASFNAALATGPDPAVPMEEYEDDTGSDDAKYLNDDLDADDPELAGEDPDLVPGPVTADHLRAALLAVGQPPVRRKGKGVPKPQSTGKRSPGWGQPPRVSAASLAAALAAAAGGSGAGGSGGGGGAADPAAAAAALRALTRAPGPSLAEVLRPDALRPLLTSDAALEALAPHLPQGHRSMAGLLDVLSSAQWRSQLETLSGAFTTGQLDVSQFGMRVAGFSIADFLQAVQDQVDREKQDKEEEVGGGPLPPPA